MKKLDVFKQGKNKMTDNAKKVLADGEKFKKKIQKLSGRLGAITMGFVFVGGLGAVESTASATFIVQKSKKMNLELDDATKAGLALLYIIGLFLALEVMGIMRTRNKEQMQGIETLMKKMNLSMDTKHATMVFGLITNYMTDAEYNKVEEIAKNWAKVKVDEIKDILVMQDFTDKISAVLNKVLERNPDLYSILQQVAYGKENIAVFQQEADKIYAQKSHMAQR